MKKGFSGKDSGEAKGFLDASDPSRTPCLHDAGTLREIGMDGHLGEARFPGEGRNFLSLVGPAFQKQVPGQLGCLG